MHYIRSIAPRWPFAFGRDVYPNAVYTAMAVRIRAFDHTLVGNHVHCRQEDVDLLPSTPEIVAKGFLPHAVKV